jgi:hypothetical protein
MVDIYQQYEEENYRIRVGTTLTVILIAVFFGAIFMMVHYGVR